MNDKESTFEPDWIFPPGRSILSLAEERGWKQVELAQRLGYTPKHISQLINGKVPITIESAQRLERVFGSTVKYWLNLESNYQRHIARLEAEKRLVDWSSWLDKLPLKELRQHRFIPDLRNDRDNKAALVDACLRYFGVASPADWHDRYAKMQVAFRRTHDNGCDVGAISTWLRAGERVAEKSKLLRFEKSRYPEILNQIRSLTVEEPAVFWPKMKDMLSSVGVLIVLVPSIPRSYVSGATRWLNDTRPMIQLSLRGKTNDKFWFTFFHEAAHVLLHADNKEEKKSIFLDDSNIAHSNDPMEIEANRWAGEFLVPEKYNSTLNGLRGSVDIKEFAKNIGIHPGIIVGRMQHDGAIEYATKLNDLKVKFCLQ